MRFALNSLAVVVPDWVLSVSSAQWVECYGHPMEESRLPKSEEDRLAELDPVPGRLWSILLQVRKIR